MRRPLPLLALVAVAALALQPAILAENDEAAVAWYRDVATVAYRAWTQDGWIVLSAEHHEGWHTYAMDNIERARVRSGKDAPETELPTEIDVGGDVASAGWLQSPPLDLSTPEIGWYTFGFEGNAYFALPLGGTHPPESLVVNGQACTDELCARIDELEVPVLDPRAEVDLDALIAVATSRDDV